jgi:hypothetical protein
MANNSISFKDYKLFILPTSRGGLLDIPSNRFTQLIGAEIATSIQTAIGFEFKFCENSFNAITLYPQGYFMLTRLGETDVAPITTNELDVTRTKPLFAIWWDNVETSPVINDALAGIWSLTNHPYNGKIVSIFKWHIGGDSSGPNKTLVCETVLHSGSNIVEFRYGPYSLINTAPAGHASVGVVTGSSYRDFYKTGHPLGGSSTDTERDLAVYQHWPHLTGSHVQPYKFVFSPPQNT